MKMRAVTEPWLKENEEKLKNLFPEGWTHAANHIKDLSFHYQTKLIGMEWSTNEELAEWVVFLFKIGVFLQEGLLIKRNPHPIFPIRLREFPDLSGL